MVSHQGIRLLLSAVCFFWALSVHAAQVFTLPQGTTTFGPVAAAQLKKYANFEIDRTLWTDPNVKLDATMDYSTDGAKTWVFWCNLTAQGGQMKNTKVTEWTCEKEQPLGTTHIRGTAVVTGGSISMPKAPGFGEK